VWRRSFSLRRTHLAGRRHDLLPCLAAALVALAACSGTPEANGPVNTHNGNGGGSPAQSGSPAGTPTGPLFTGDGGRGITIAVPAPSLSGGGAADAWMPQLFQDLLTGDLARYSAMTVLDRLNESLILAEQELSASGAYSDDDYIDMGRLTNAKYIAAGSIQRLSGRYSVSFRVNDTETNEIRASFNRQYGAEDIESGLAAKEAARELLAGLGVELTPEGERRLLAVQEMPVRARVSLARGMAAEKSGDDIDALAYYFQALDANGDLREAAANIQNFAQGSPGASIRERANWAAAQKEKWEKIFADLNDYALNNLLIVVYDFSVISDKIDLKSNTVGIEVTPGLKLIPNRTVLAVWKSVTDTWREIKNREENKSWAGAVRTDYEVTGAAFVGGRNQQSFKVTAGLYDEYGGRIAATDISDRGLAVRGTGVHSSITANFKMDTVFQQQKFYDNIEFQKVRFSRVPLGDITDELSVKVDRVRFESGSTKTIQPLVLSVDGWLEWLAANGGR